MKPEVTKFRCYDCLVKSSKEKLITKTVTELREYSNWPRFKTNYECSLGLSDCRNLKLLSNSEFMASYVRALKERESVSNRRANC